MRKINCFIIILFLISFLIACEPEKYFFMNNDRNDDIVSIEIISYTADTIEIIDTVEEMVDIDLDKIVLLETLDQSFLGEFIVEFSNLEFMLGFSHVNTPSGIGLKLNYSNDDFLLVVETIIDDDSYCDAIMYNSEGEFLEYFGGLSRYQNYVDLVNNYFDEHIN